MSRWIRNEDVQIRNGADESAFGEKMFVTYDPQIQVSFRYGIQDTLFETFTATGGSYNITNSMLEAYTGTSVGGYCVVRTKKFFQYRPGMGAAVRFSGMFSEPAANQIQWIGLGSLENKLSVGYNGTNFGINRRTGGLAELRTLTVTGTDGTGGNAVVTLNGTATNVAITGGTNTNAQAWEISQGTYSGWNAQAVGNTVTFQATSIGSKAGTFSYAGPVDGTGTFARTRAGAADIDNWVYQADWNIDPLDGTGQTGMLLDPQKGNVYQIRYQWLGFGRIVFSVEDPITGNLIDVHEIQYANKNTSPSLLDPSMQIEVVAASLGGTTNVTTSSASMAGMTQGIDQDRGVSYATRNTATISTTETPLFTVKVARLFGSKINFSEIHLKILSFASSSTGNKPGRINVYRGATLSGTPNFNFVDSSSSVLVDKSATGLSGGRLIASFSLPSTGGDTVDLTPLNQVLNKEDVLTVAAVASAGSIDFSAALTWEEDI